MEKGTYENWYLLLHLTVKYEHIVVLPNINQHKDKNNIWGSLKWLKTWQSIKLTT